MLRKKKQKIIEEKRLRAADSTVKLITKDLLNKLNITLPLDEDSADVLAEYFESEEISLAQDQEARIPYDEQYMRDICRAVDDFYPSDNYTSLDISDLNSRLQQFFR